MLLSYFLTPLLIGKRTHIFSFFFSRSSFFRKWKKRLKERKNRYCFLFSLLPTSFTYHLFSPFFFLSIFRFRNGKGKGGLEERIHFFLFPFLLLIRKPKQATAYSSLPPLLLFEKRKEMGPKKSTLFLFCSYSSSYFRNGGRWWEGGDSSFSLFSSSVVPSIFLLKSGGERRGRYWFSFSNKTYPFTEENLDGIMCARSAMYARHTLANNTF